MRIVLGVSGGIAAYKAAEIARLDILRQMIDDEILQQRAALVDALLVDQRGDVIPHRRRKLRLLVHEAHGVVGLEIAQRAGNGLLGNAGSGGCVAKAGEARAPIRPRGRGEEAEGGDGRGKEASVFHGGDNSPKGLTRANYRGRVPSFSRPREKDSRSPPLHPPPNESCALSMRFLPPGR